ncbi:PAS domain-containing sensor histidine kinase [candidate division KSB1 bacterium]
MLKRIPFYWKLTIAFAFAIMLILVVDISLERITEVRLRTFLIIVVTFVLSAISAWLIVKLSIRPSLKKLADGMSDLAQKKFDVRLNEIENDEFGTIFSSFNVMSVLISSYQSELIKAREFLNSILESTADIIISVNARKKILTFNSGAEKALGYKREEVIGKPIEMIFAKPEERERAIERLKYGDNVVNIETQFLTKSGEARDVLLTLTQMRHTEGTFVGTFGISKDITVRTRLQKQLIQAQRLSAIGEVFIGIQHSMKNMLNTCQGGAYMVKVGLAKDKRDMFEEGWGMVKIGIDRMTDLSRDMLKYVKEWKPRFEPVDLAKILLDIELEVKQNSKDKGIEFILDLSQELPLVQCDPPMIHSMVMDIVSNAVDACFWKEYPDKDLPKITVRAYLNHGKKNAIIEVEDNGCGMTDEVKAKMYTPFFSTKSKAGTGLGLSITSRMIEVHKGSIEVESESDKGTVFRILLPVNVNIKNKENNDGKESVSN